MTSHDHRYRLRPSKVDIPWRLLLTLAILPGVVSVARALPTNAELDAARAFLQALPTTAHHAPERRQRLAVIQAATDELDPATYLEYMTAALRDPAHADKLERAGALYYLASCTRSALADIRTTRVTSGVAIWYLYNMGYVVKTPDSCFGIDICLRDGARLAPDLDFLLITHEHRDHSTADLLDAMLTARKPVVTRWYPGSTVITTPTELQFGTTRVRVEIGDHHREQPGQTDNMLMYQITCGNPKAPFTLYHSGDGNNADKIHPDRPVDVFIYHVSVGLDARAAVTRVDPRATFVSHVLELGHSPKPPQPWRWSFAYAFGVAKGLTPRNTFVFSWGERWLAPGTEIAAPAKP